MPYFICKVPELCLWPELYCEIQRFPFFLSILYSVVLIYLFLRAHKCPPLLRNRFFSCSYFSIFFLLLCSSSSFFLVFLSISSYFTDNDNYKAFQTVELILVRSKGSQKNKNFKALVNLWSLEQGIFSEAVRKKKRRGSWQWGRRGDGTRMRMRHKWRRIKRKWRYMGK